MKVLQLWLDIYWSSVLPYLSVQLTVINSHPKCKKFNGTEWLAVKVWTDRAAASAAPMLVNDDASKLTPPHFQASGGASPNDPIWRLTHRLPLSPFIPLERTAFESHQHLNIYKYADQKISTAMLAIRRSAGVTLVVDLRNPLHASEESILNLKLRADITRSPKQENQQPHKKDWCHPKNCLIMLGKTNVKNSSYSVTLGTISFVLWCISISYPHNFHLLFNTNP